MPRFDGADLSHHQSDVAPVNWGLLRSVSWWCATKATQGTGYVDPSFGLHWSRMREHGFSHRIAYGWLSPRVDPVRQANHFLNTVLPLRVGEGCMIDAEERGITAADVIAWLDTVESVIQRPCMVYTGAFVAGGTIWQSTTIRNGKHGHRAMHIAAYTSEAQMRTLPGLSAYPPHGWQYSSDGPVAGVSGRCDMNMIFDRAAYDAVCAIPPPPPDLGDESMPAFISNKQAGRYGAAPSPQGGCTIWELQHGRKRALSFAEWVGYGQPFGVACDDATLDAIPDYSEPVLKIDPNTRINMRWSGDGIGAIG